MTPGSGAAEREWLELAADVLDRPLTELPIERIAGQLIRTFAGVGCAYCTRRDGGPQTVTIYPLAESFAGHRATIQELATSEAAGIHPVLRYYRAVGVTGPVQVADVPERLIGPGRLGAWYARARPCGCADQLALPVYVRGAAHRAWVIGRDRPFGPAELQLALRVRRLLIGLDRQCEGRAEAAARRLGTAGGLRLTPREITVLTLLVEGLTAGAIARRLAIGERTVQKHLEHAYAKLGVRDRLSAVLRAQHLGLIRAA